MKKLSLFALLTILFISCKKEEGVGGLATIKGIVYQQNINCLLNNSGTSFPAMDKDVYIQYGNNNYVSDKVETSPTGNFQFDYLTPGDYTIYIYSDDNQSFDADEDIVISQQVKISGKKETLDVGQLVIYKHVDIDDGTANISGIVKKLIYAEGTTIVIDTILAQNTDVFLLLEGEGSCSIKEKTMYDGKYYFNNLIRGNYTLYVLSEQAYTQEDIPVSVEFEINSEITTLELETILISDF